MTGSPGGPDAAAVCLDVGSYWTKAVLVQPDGTPAGFAEHPTTPDVLEGVDAAVAAAAASVGRHAGGPAPEVLACSSAGGPLRLAVVGAERLTATEAAHRVCRSAGARVVGVHTGPLAEDGVRQLAGQQPGVVLLLGGSDGDDPEVLLHNAGRLAGVRGRWPVLLAVPDAARDDALELLRSGGRTVTACPNVTPRPGELVPGPVREAVAEIYARHALGGPGEPGRFGAMARTRTPVAVGGGTAVLARATGSGVLVVDVGSATTDVHSVVPPGAPRRGAPRPGASQPDDGATAMTVEGDLGVRDAAGSVLVEAQTEGLVDPVEADLLAPAVGALEAASRLAAPAVPADRGAAAEDRRLAAIAAVVALRRHLRHTGRIEEAAPGGMPGWIAPGDPHDPGAGPAGPAGEPGHAGVAAGGSARVAGARPVPEVGGGVYGPRHGGDIGLVVLTGGVFRQRDPAGLAAVAETVRRDPVLLAALAQVDVRVDSESVLAPAGLLAAHGREEAARALLAERLPR